MIVPAGARILIDPEKPKTETPGGIHLPNAAQVAPPKGRIVRFAGGEPILVPDVGTATDAYAQALNIGDMVYYPYHAGFEVTVPLASGKDHTYLIIQARDIIAIETKDPEPEPTTGKE